MSPGLSPSLLLPSGLAPDSIDRLGRVQRAAGHGARQASTANTLFVNDSVRASVDVMKYQSSHGTWKTTGTITDGIDGPNGNWVDKLGNLYVANYKGPYITEYNSAGSLIFTYSSGMDDSVDVATDKEGNVYEADFNYSVANGGFINEYAQGSNTVLTSCAPGGNVTGVAIDQHGNVFVAFWNGSYGQIAEYTHPLSRCKETVLGATVSFPGGMVLDKNDNLIIVDEDSLSVDVIDPPYAGITNTLGNGYSLPTHVTINDANSQVYVADPGNDTVQVLNYPSGSNITTLTQANGFSDPQSAVAGKNYVP